MAAVIVDSPRTGFNSVTHIGRKTWLDLEGLNGYYHCWFLRLNPSWTGLIPATLLTQDLDWTDYSLHT